MRRFVFAVFAVVGFGSGIAVAEELKAPQCDKPVRGVIWNFGSEESPDLRRCDGISYVPWAHAAAKPAEVHDKNSCGTGCMHEERECEASCAPSFLDADCRSRCQRSEVQCKIKC